MSPVEPVIVLYAAIVSAIMIILNYHFFHPEGDFSPRPVFRQGRGQQDRRPRGGLAGPHRSHRSQVRGDCRQGDSATTAIITFLM